MSYANFLTEHRRLGILKILRAAPGFRENDIVLKRLLHRRGHSISRDAVKTDLHWLHEQGAVALDQLDDGLFVAELTDRGIDIADGVARSPGIAEPGSGV